MLDGLFDQDTILDIREHFTDTGGASDHVFGLFALIGKRFAPRLRNLKDRKLHTFEKADAYSTLTSHIGAPIDTALILDHWNDLLHLATSISTRIRCPLDDPEEALGVAEGKPFGQGAAGSRPDRAIDVHDRMVFEPGLAPVMPSRPQQRRGSAQAQACGVLP